MFCDRSKKCESKEPCVELGQVVTTEGAMKALFAAGKAPGEYLSRLKE